MKINLPYRFLRWLNRQFELVREKERQAHLHRVATLASSSQIGPEGVIENVFGDPGSIVVGENSYVRSRLLTYGHGGNISIGKWCYIGVRTEIWSMKSITIGNRVLISHDVNIHDGDAHSKNAEERHQQYRHILEHGHPLSWDELPGVKSAPIVIEDDVWVSFGVTILKGVTLGRGCIIAAGSIVMQDVPAGMLYRNEITPSLTYINY